MDSEGERDGNRRRTQPTSKRGRVITSITPRYFWILSSFILPGRLSILSNSCRWRGVRVASSCTFQELRRGRRSMPDLAVPGKGGENLRRLYLLNQLLQRSTLVTQSAMYVNSTRIISTTHANPSRRFLQSTDLQGNSGEAGLIRRSGSGKQGDGMRTRTRTTTKSNNFIFIIFIWVNDFLLLEQLSCLLFFE